MCLIDMLSEPDLVCPFFLANISVFWHDFIFRKEAKGISNEKYKKEIASIDAIQ